MEFKKQHIMKQPELGQKILALRKQKGFTQEELVEQCNINVRTIQRIEAGDVSPRSYTIKAILEVLGFDYSTIFEKTYSSGKFDKLLKINKANFSKTINLAWIFGIVYFIVGFFEIATEYYRFEEKEQFISNGLYIFVKMISVVSFILFFRGFVAVANMYKSYLLEIIAFLMILSTLLFGFFDILSFYFYAESLDYLTIIKLVLFGVLMILFGIGILKLGTKEGTLFTVIGILEIIAGFLLAIILLADIGLFLLLPLELLEIILLYKIASKLKITV
ncbi:MAG: helix-turn-helix domain-containing protein [Polaribacter sp.]